MRTLGRSLVLTGAMATLLATQACESTSAPPTARAGGVTPPATRASASAGPIAPPTRTSTPDPTPTPITTAGGPLTLGPYGLGALRLGMTGDEVRATKLVEDFHDPASDAGCASTRLKDAQENGADNTGFVIISPDRGLVAINAWGQISTPEGLRVGDTYAKVHALYPTWTGLDGHTGRGLAPVSGNPAAVYRIVIGEDGTVASVMLQAENQDCYE